VSDLYAENTEQVSTDVSELIDKYRQSPDKNLRNEIVMQSMHIVRYAVLSTRNMYRRYADDDDISNEAVLALMNAVDSFDPSKNVKFDTYASIKVRGAIIDYIRRQDTVPRGVRKFIRDYDSAYSSLYTELDREPTREETAARLGIDTDKLDSCLSRSAAAATLSFEEMLFDGFDMPDESAENAAEAELIISERRTQLAAAIDSLKDKERTVITLYYYEKLKYSEIAKVMGISESRICQIHTKAVDKLREKISGYVLG
jgi:RNA polymerase sigma factor for flagellar operon FliA